jgi:hypothetical protein
MKKLIVLIPMLIFVWVFGCATDHGPMGRADDMLNSDYQLELPR